jgi:hypothetical protein
MTPKTLLRLWWKAKDIGHLHPVRKLVHRFGRHGDLQVFHQTFYEAQKQPDQPTPEGLTELFDVAKVRQWYDDLREKFEREIDRVWWQDPAWGLGRDEWEQAVNDAHKDLGDAFGSDRVMVVLPASASSLKSLSHREILGLAYFALLEHQLRADIIHYALDKVELPYVYWHAVNSTLSDAAFEMDLNRALSRNSELVEPLLLESTSSANIRPLPDTVIDPNSKKEIQTDDYFKRMLPVLEEAFDETVLYQLERVSKYLPNDARLTVARRETEREITFSFRHPDTELTLKPQYWDEILDWVKAHPETLKAIFSYVLPTGDRDVAVLGLYAGIRTMQDFVKLCTSPEFEKFSAPDILDYVQASFEHRVEEGKRVFGLERFPIPPRRVWGLLWQTLDSLYDMGRAHEVEDEDVEGIKPKAALALRDMLGWQHWDKWEEHHSQMLKHVVGTLFGQDAIKDFDDRPFRSGRLGKMLQTLWFFGYGLKRLGLLALGKDLEPLKEKVKGLASSELSEKGDHKLIAQKAVRKFHNAMSSAVKHVQKVKDWFVKQFGKINKIAAVIDYSPLGFYSLTKDGTCFGGSNRHHPFILSALNNSFVLRVFVPGVGYLGRMWGVIFPDEKVAYLTNRYGDLNITNFKGLAQNIFATLFQVHPDDININDAPSDFERVIDTLITTAEYTIGYSQEDLPYLNGDAFKVSVKRG